MEVVKVIFDLLAAGKPVLITPAGAMKILELQKVTAVS